jgi:hypothetical protein
MAGFESLCALSLFHLFRNIPLFVVTKTPLYPKMGYDVYYFRGYFEDGILDRRSEMPEGSMPETASPFHLGGRSYECV